MTQETLINDAGAAVVLSEWALGDGRALAVATLNAPKTLNSLTLEMIDLLDPQLRRWAGDDRIVAVYLRGEGSRAFCAGGDIQALYHAMKRNHEAGEVVDRGAEDFFEREYRLDHLLHRFPKPVICFGNGVVMGGGLGLLSAASHPVVTDTSRVAMPEITIGLFPDAGGTALLSRMPGSIGLFLGLTGAQINGGDALEVGLGRFLVGSDEAEALEGVLRELAWQGDARADAATLDAALADLQSRSAVTVPDSNVAALRGDIDAALEPVAGDFHGVIKAVRGLAGRHDWIDKGIQTLEHGCPVTAGIVVEQLRRATGMALADMFRMELVIGTHCARRPDFAEGVRALLIDKDKTPKWSVPSLDALDSARVQAHFEAPWARHPLADLND